MYIQYMYPIATYDIIDFENSLGVEEAQYWSLVDNGVSTPDDVERMYSYVTDAPFGSSPEPSFSFYSDDMYVTPDDTSSMWMNIRIRMFGGVPVMNFSDYGFTFTDSSGSTFTAFGFSKDIIGSHNTWQNHSLKLNAMSASGNFNGVFYPPLECKIYVNDITHVSGGFVSGSDNYIEFQISEVEVVSSGENLLVPHNEMTLYITGPLPDSSGMTLYTQAGANFKDTTLFIEGHETAETGITLFVGGIDYSHSGCDLYIEAGLSHNSFDLFLDAVDPVATSSGLNLTMWTVGSSSGYASLSNTLYIFNSATIDSGAPLYINSENAGILTKQATMFIDGGIYPSGQMSLFTSGPNPYQSSTPMFIEGARYRANQSATLFTRNNYYDIESNNIPLFISNRLDSSGGMTLHTLAGFYQDAATLYIKTLEENDASGFTPLFIYSATNSGLFQTTPLYINAVGTSKNIPLYIRTDESAEEMSSITLFTKAGNEFTSSVQLYVESVRESGNGINFNIIGAGLNPNADVLRGSIPLYMARQNDSVGNGFGLIIDGPSGYTSTVPLSVKGGTFSQESSTLVIPVVNGQYSGGMNLYTHGF